MSLSDKFHENRFAALEEFLSIVGLKRSEWASLFKVLRKANCGFIKFCISDDVSIEVHVGSGPSLGEGFDDWIRIEFKVVKDRVEKSTVYTFEVIELEALDREKQLKIADG